MPLPRPRHTADRALALVLRLLLACVLCCPLLTLTAPVDKALARLGRTLADAQPDLAWLSRVFAGGEVGGDLADLHARIGRVLRAIADRDRRSDPL